MAVLFIVSYEAKIVLIIPATSFYLKHGYRSPLSNLLSSEVRLEESLFNKWILFQYIEEDEYIMRTNASIYCLCASCISKKVMKGRSL